jgi:two-component system, OmpR family, response regulator QseB
VPYYNLMKILLVEDDPELGNGTRIALIEQGFDVTWLKTIRDAQYALAAKLTDMVLLDLGLPDGDGLALLIEIRREFSTLPILVITARDSLQNRLAGLDNGADDYLIKPFALSELVSRIHAIARRTYGYLGDTLEVRQLKINEVKMSAALSGRELDLSKTEFAILTLLIKRADKVVTRQFLEEQALSSALNRGSNILDVHISNLRRKIGDDYIRTVRGVGYVIDREINPKADKQ